MRLLREAVLGEGEITNIEVIDTTNDKTVQSVRGDRAKYDAFLKRYGSKGDRYIVQGLDSGGKIVIDNQGTGGKLRKFEDVELTEETKVYVRASFANKADKRSVVQYVEKEGALTIEKDGGTYLIISGDKNSINKLVNDMDERAKGWSFERYKK